MYLSASLQSFSIIHRQKTTTTITCNPVIAHSVKPRMSGNTSPSIPVTPSFFPNSKYTMSASTDALQKKIFKWKENVAKRIGKSLHVSIYMCAYCLAFVITVCKCPSQIPRANHNLQLRLSI